MKQTENYQLNQWESGDRILMADFNNDNAKLEAALDALEAGKADAATVNSLSGTVSTLSGTVGQKADASALTAEVSARTAAVNTINTQLAARGNCQIYYGTYVGDGATTRTLTFPRKPLLVIVMGSNIILRTVQGAPYAMCRTNGDGGELAKATWSDNSLTWQGTSLSYICNVANITYHMVVLMDASD